MAAVHKTIPQKAKNINLDGKTLAHETVSYTDAELAKRERLFKRGVMA